ncbi:allatostatin A preprohormone precursor [Bombyx mori]|uniref:Allatostatin preprohormone n=1 Tax=Bombyx mori TaxID=7091 RepID=Q8WPI4_BOMMO|nr:allatostatin A preprohormone precursor [Bombyx mori]AAL47057.1 allatostatin preprohormone [Bombyx mori]
MLSACLPLLLVLGAALAAEQVAEHGAEQVAEHAAPLEKRSPQYDFGLGKRAYSYVSEYKRLPVYNFGLGKRSRPYLFGLGKRSAGAEQLDDDISNEADQNTLDELFDQYDDSAAVPTGYVEKRARPYSFGLGKRFAEEPAEDKRARMYSFGLGKRARSYSFGLGKRLSSKFNFGLGKRQRDMHRFSFGLGKRSEDDTSENYIDA